MLLVVSCRSTLARAMRPSFFFFCTVLLTLAKISSAQSSPDANRALALDKILEAARVICTSVPVSGSSTVLELDGTARAEIEGLLEDLSKLGIEGASKFQNSNYSGVLQSELANQIQRTNECRFSVLTLLSATLLDASMPKDIQDERIESASVAKSAALLGADPDQIYTDDLISAAIMSSSVDANQNEWLSFSIIIKNISREKLKISYPDRIPADVVAFDDLGKSYDFHGLSGVARTECGMRADCADREVNWTTLSPGSQYTVVVRARGYSDKRSPSTASLAINLLLSASDNEVEMRSVGFPNVILKK